MKIHFEKGNRKNTWSKAVFQAMLLKFKKSFNEVKVLVKSEINEASRMYELQERPHG